VGRFRLRLMDDTQVSKLRARHRRWCSLALLRRCETAAVWVTLARGRRVFFDVDGESLAVDGARMRVRPALVLIHGAEVDHSFFKPWASPLAECAQLVYVDLIGHGRSDPGAEADWMLDSWDDSVDELCERIGLERPVILGSSLAGRVAMKVGLRHPRGRVRSSS
jgi:pimeloyl-ACP methyl ester carboxylesterase